MSAQKNPTEEIVSEASEAKASQVATGTAAGTASKDVSSKDASGITSKASNDTEAVKDTHGSLELSSEEKQQSAKAAKVVQSNEEVPGLGGDFAHTDNPLKQPPEGQSEAVERNAHELEDKVAHVSTNVLDPLQLAGAVDPTSIMVGRCHTWSALLQHFGAYFHELQQVLEQQVQLHERAAKAIDFPFLEGASARVKPPTPHQGNILRNASAEFRHHEDLQFLPYGNESISDVPIQLLTLHREAAKSSASTAAYIRKQLLPRIEQTRRSLGKAAQDFSGISSQFQGTQKLKADRKVLIDEIQQYSTAVASALKGHASSVDPYVLKLHVDHLVAKQIKHENALLSSYKYAEDAAKEVDRGVVLELQDLFREFSNLMGTAGDHYVTCAAALVEGFVSKPPLHEFDAFVTREPHTFINAKTPLREEAATHYSYKNSNLALIVHKGKLGRRTKYLKSFTPGEYVLTPQTLFEFKEGQPVFGVDLTDAKLDKEHKHWGDGKFVLEARQANSSSGKIHSWVFRADDSKTWISYLEKIVGKKGEERAIALFGSAETAAAGTGAVAGAGAVAASSKAVEQEPVSHAPQTDELAAAGVDQKKAASGVREEANDPTQGLYAVSGEKKSIERSISTEAVAPSSSKSSVAGVEGVAGEATSNRARRPSNYKKDDEQVPALTQSLGATAGGEHGLTGIDVASTNPQPQSYRSDSNAKAEAAGAVGVTGLVVGLVGLNKEQADGLEGNTTQTTSSQTKSKEHPEGGFNSEHYELTNKEISHPAERVEGLDKVAGKDGQIPIDSTAHAGGDTTYNDDSQSDISDVEYKQVGDSKANLADESALGIAAKDLKIWDKINGFGSTTNVAAGTAGAAANAGESSRDLNQQSFAEYRADYNAGNVKDSAIDENQSDAESTFSYDRKHRASTYRPGDEDELERELGPASPAIERRLTSTSHKLEATSLSAPALPTERAADDASSVFSYDNKHDASTYTEGDEKKLTENALPPSVERKLTETRHRDSVGDGASPARLASEADDPTDKVLERRRSSVSIKSLNRKGSRRATASYGDDELKPLTSGAGQGASLFFQDGLPDTTSGKN